MTEATASSAKIPTKRRPVTVLQSRLRRNFLWVVFAVAFVLSAVFLFARLGHYALWDDETYSSLAAEGILATGDTTAVIGHNVVAYSNGLMLHNLYDRFTPPLPAYIIAGFFRVLGVSAWAARLPFALCGLASVGLLGYWLWKKEATLLRVFLMAVAVTGNVSLFLYCRQARYYAAAIFLSLALAYLYSEWKGTRRQIALAALASIALFASHYLAYVALYGILLVDYVFWQRREVKFRWRELLWLFGLQAVVCLPLTMVWNPFGTEHGGRLFSNTLFQRLTLVWWNLRDLNHCEFGVGVLLLVAPILYAVRRDSRLIRGIVAIVGYIVIVCIFSPQTVSNTSVADIRYIVPLIPLCIFLGVLSLEAMTEQLPWIAIPVALVAFHTNLLHGRFLADGNIRSTTLAFVEELAHPPGDPYTVTANWINENVRENESIWVMPGFMAYPLIFHAPKAIYAWQLDAEAKNANGQFAKLPAIHFKGGQPPDYAIFFGPAAEELFPKLQAWSHGAYRPVALLDIFWKDAYRPELFWRSFEPLAGYDRNREAIYIVKRNPPPPNPLQQ